MKIKRKRHNKSEAMSPSLAYKVPLSVPKRNFPEKKLQSSRWRMSFINLATHSMCVKIRTVSYCSSLRSLVKLKRAMPKRKRRLSRKTLKRLRWQRSSPLCIKNSNSLRRTKRTFRRKQRHSKRKSIL